MASQAPKTLPDLTIPERIQIKALLKRAQARTRLQTKLPPFPTRPLSFPVRLTLFQSIIIAAQLTTLTAPTQITPPHIVLPVIWASALAAALTLNLLTDHILTRLLIPYLTRTFHA